MKAGGVGDPSSVPRDNTEAIAPPRATLQQPLVGGDLTRDINIQPLGRISL
jgi:hypothetical protein